MRRVERAALPDISIRQLEYLVAVADSSTWSAAAAAVGVSASALSQGMAELERRIGVDLFERLGRRRVLRASAQPVLDHARQVVSLTHDLTDWAQRLRSARSGRVRLGLIDVAAVVHFPEVLRAFRAELPDVDLTLTVAPSAVLIHQLWAGLLDLVVCVEPDEPPPGVRLVDLLREPLWIFAPTGTVIGPAPSWGPWVTFPDGSHTRTAVFDELRTRGAPLHVAAESHQPDVLMEMVALGLGWTVLPHRDSLPEHIVIGHVLLERRVVLARRVGAVQDPAVDELTRRLSGAVQATAAPRPSFT